MELNKGGGRIIYDLPVCNPGLRELYPLFAGFQACESGHSYGPAMRDYYLIHCIMKGNGILHYGKMEYCLTAGQCFLISPKDITFYQADKNSPWQYTWIAFNGEMAEEFISKTGLGSHNPVFSSKEISNIFLELTERIPFSKSTDENISYYLLSIIYNILYYLPYCKKDDNTKDRYINKAKDYIGALYSREITVETLARYCGLDRHYLSRIFKERTGFTPQDYLVNTRMENAFALVISSSLSISEISRSVGYTDIYNFSKMFKKRYGASPIQYRRKFVK